MTKEYTASSLANKRPPAHRGPLADAAERERPQLGRSRCAQALGVRAIVCAYVGKEPSSGKEHCHEFGPRQVHRIAKATECGTNQDRALDHCVGHH